MKYYQIYWTSRPFIILYDSSIKSGMLLIDDRTVEYFNSDILDSKDILITDEEFQFIKTNFETILC